MASVLARASVGRRTGARSRCSSSAVTSRVRWTGRCPRPRPGHPGAIGPERSTVASAAAGGGQAGQLVLAQPAASRPARPASRVTSTAARPRESLDPRGRRRPAAPYRTPGPHRRAPVSSRLAVTTDSISPSQPYAVPPYPGVQRKGGNQRGDGANVSYSITVRLEVPAGAAPSARSPGRWSRPAAWLTELWT